MAVVYLDGKNNNGVSGTVRFESVKPCLTRVTVDLSGLIPLTAHAIHIHEKGDLSKGCMGTGGHWNPRKTTHGSYLDLNKPRHLGDLINNIFPDETGRVYVQFDDVGYNPEHVQGRAVVIHSLADDLGLQGVIQTDGSVRPYKQMSFEELTRLSNERNYDVGTAEEMWNKLNSESLKTGNAGGRMACGVIGIL
jgi:Cu-Zn family superoxide dismutase